MNYLTLKVKVKVEIFLVFKCTCLVSKAKNKIAFLNKHSLIKQAAYFNLLRLDFESKKQLTN